MSDIESTNGNYQPTRDACAVVFALVLPTVVTLAYFVWSEGMDPGVRQAIYGVAKVVQFGFPLVWVLFAQRHRPKLWPLSPRSTNWSSLTATAFRSVCWPCRKQPTQK